MTFIDAIYYDGYNFLKNPIPRQEVLTMPYPEGHKVKVRGRIIESAAKAFRANGVRDISVPAIMKGAGLTHGGFYSHFDSKEHLVSETCRFAVNDTIELLRRAVEQEPNRSGILVVIDHYLSPDHRDNTEIGCIFPALSGEISRLSEEVRQVFTEELERVIEYLSDLAEVDSSKGRALFSLLIGTLVLARSVNDSSISDSILESGRQQAKRMIQPS